MKIHYSDVNNATILARNVGKAYIKINGGTTNQFTLDDSTISVNEKQVRILPSDWQALHQWLSKTNLKPIVALPYTSKQWSPRNIISILGLSNRLGVRNCIWQLGSGKTLTLHIEQPQSYWRQQLCRIIFHLKLQTMQVIPRS